MGYTENLINLNILGTDATNAIVNNNKTQMNAASVYIDTPTEFPTNAIDLTVSNSVGMNATTSVGTESASSIIQSQENSTANATLESNNLQTESIATFTAADKSLMDTSIGELLENSKFLNSIKNLFTKEVTDTNNEDSESKEDLKAAADSLDEATTVDSDLNSITTGKNTAITQIVDAGNDIMKNCFDVLIVMLNKEESKKLTKTSVLSEDFSLSTMLDQDSLLVRTASIKIPTPVYDTFEFSFLDKKYTKKRSKIKFDKQAELSVLLDESLYTLNLIQYLSATNSSIHDIYGTEGNKVYPTNNLPLLVGPLYNKYTINIVVRVGMTQSLEMWENKLYPINNNQNLFVFEDVKFFGAGQELTFKRDSADIITMNYPFIFKHSYMLEDPSNGDIFTSFLSNEVSVY